MLSGTLTTPHPLLSQGAVVVVILGSRCPFGSWSDYENDMYSRFSYAISVQAGVTGVAGVLFGTYTYGMLPDHLPIVLPKPLCALDRWGYDTLAGLLQAAASSSLSVDYTNAQLYSSARDAIPDPIITYFSTPALDSPIAAVTATFEPASFAGANVSIVQAVFKPACLISQLSDAAISSAYQTCQACFALATQANKTAAFLTNAAAVAGNVMLVYAASTSPSATGCIRYFNQVLQHRTYHYIEFCFCRKGGAGNPRRKPLTRFKLFFLHTSSTCSATTRARLVSCTAWTPTRSRWCPAATACPDPRRCPSTPSCGRTRCR